MEINLTKKFGDVIRKLREDHGLSQEQLAEKADLNRSFLGEVERGNKVPSLLTLGKLSAALGENLSSIFAQCESR